MKKNGICHYLNIACFVLFITCVLPGCSATHDYYALTLENDIKVVNNERPPPEIYYAGFKTTEINEQGIFKLSESQEIEIKDYVKRNSSKQKPVYQVVASYLEDFAYSFDYQSETNNARTSFAIREGNCLSLAILSSAIAKIAGVDYKYKKVHSAPVHHQQAGLELVSTHVNITLFDKKKNNADKRSPIVLVPASITIDYFRDSGSVTSEQINEQELQILFWQNLASQALLDKDWDLAFSYTLKANELNPKHPETLNLFAVLYGKINRHEKALEVYEYASNEGIYSYTLIDNYARLLNRNGNKHKAEQLLSQVRDINESNPYVWLQLGKTRLQQGRLSLAEEFFQKSAELGPYLHEPKHQLALVYTKQGKLDAAKQALLEAKEIAHSPVDRQRFVSKLYALKNMRTAR